MMYSSFGGVGSDFSDLLKLAYLVSHMSAAISLLIAVLDFINAISALSLSHSGQFPIHRVNNGYT